MRSLSIPAKVLVSDVDLSTGTEFSIKLKILVIFIK